MVINLTNVPTKDAIDMAKGCKTTKIRIKGAFENKIVMRVAKSKKTIKIWRLKLIRWINQAIIDHLQGRNEKISDTLVNYWIIDFEEKYSSDDIYRMMLTLPTELKKKPTLSAIQSLYNVSKRQAIKIREMIPKDVYNVKKSHA